MDFGESKLNNQKQLGNEGSIRIKEKGREKELPLISLSITSVGMSLTRELPNFGNFKTSSRHGLILEVTRTNIMTRVHSHFKYCFCIDPVTMIAEFSGLFYR